MSLPVAVEGMTLGSRALLQITASQDLLAYLPFSAIPDIDVGLTESAFEGSGWRNDWWDPHRDNSIGPDEAFRRLRSKTVPEGPCRALVVAAGASGCFVCTGVGGRVTWASGTVTVREWRLKESPRGHGAAARLVAPCSRRSGGDWTRR